MRLRRIDPVEQRTGNPFLMLARKGLCIAAGLLCIPIEATREGVHRCNQLKVRTERQRAFGATDGDNLVFHWLAHHFQDARAELGKPIQEQNTAMCEGNLAWLGNVPATDQACMTNRMMRGTKWTVPDQRRACGELIGNGINARDIERLFDAQFMLFN